MLTLIFISIIVALVAYIFGNAYLSKHPSDGTYLYGFTMDADIAIMIGIIVFLIGLIMGSAVGYFKWVG